MNCKKKDQYVTCFCGNPEENDDGVLEWPKCLKSERDECEAEYERRDVERLAKSEVK